MSFQTLKASLLIVMLSLFMVACSGTSTQEGDASAIDSNGVATGTATDSGTYGSDLGAGGVATVFYFEFDKSLLNADARAALNIHAERLRSNPRPVRLEGHADERGTREYNMALGERRANAVKEYLVLQGVDGSYLEAISYGEERPAQLGSDDQSWSLNRRVEMK